MRYNSYLGPRNWERRYHAAWAEMMSRPLSYIDNPGIGTTKEEKEQAIIRLLREIPESGYGPYFKTDNLRKVIIKVMGYTATENGICKNDEDWEKVVAIIRRMREKGIVRWSKTGEMCKLNV